MDESFKAIKDHFLISNDIKKIDLDRLHYFLAKESYWNQNIPKDLLQKAIKNSLNFSVLDTKERKFIGFARVITDFATFGYLCDVFIDKDYRGNGLGKWLMKTIMDYSETQGLRFWFLMTRDAHGLYEKYGFKPLQNPKNGLGIRIPATELYKPLE